jgi:hypothetical protein
LLREFFSFQISPRLNKGLKNPALGFPANLPFQEVRYIQTDDCGLGKEKGCGTQEIVVFCCRLATHGLFPASYTSDLWIPAFAGMTKWARDNEMGAG